MDAFFNTLKNDAVASGRPSQKFIFNWSDQLATGLDDVDAQHRKLLGLVNKLDGMQACGTPSEELIAVYDELKSYTLFHFGHEEELMNAWPVDQVNKAAHLQEHREFIERIGKIDQLILSLPAYVVDHLLPFLVNWLIHHISGVDQRMAKEIIVLRSGRPDHGDGGPKDQQSNTISDLYDGIGIRSLEIIDLNIQLQTEIGRRRKAEDDAQLATLVFDNSSDAMSVTDAENKIIAVNPAFTRLTGYQPEEVIGQNPNILNSGRYDQSFYQVMWESILETGHWDGELWNRRKNGEVYAEKLTINTIYKADGSVDRRISVFSDITKKKLTQEKLARQAADLKDLVEKEARLNARLSREIAVKNRLFSIIAHDLRSPFTLLTGMTQTMVQKADSYSKEKLIEKAGIINRVSKSVYNAVENLLDWSQTQLDGKQLDIRSIPLRDVVAETLTLLGPVAKEKGIEIVSAVGAQEAMADHHVMVTILRNLLSNAIKFSENGGTVEVTVQGMGDRVEIAVSDSGVGIPERMIDKLFAIDKKTTTLGTSGEKGTGLGLPLCADLAQEMGGSIRVESTPQKGSRFSVILPATGSGGL